MSSGELVFIGLGLHDEKDISLKALEEAKTCEKLFAEFYTAKLAGVEKKQLEKQLGKKLNVLDRAAVERGDDILQAASDQKVGFLICGDPLVATTHVDLRLRALGAGIKTSVIHGSSILTAVPGLLGLQHYKFGRTTTLAFPEKDYFPRSPYGVIRDNKKLGLHTLVLLDIQAEKERYMRASEGLELLLKMEKEKKEGACTEESLAGVVARAGSKKPVVAAGLIKDLKERDFGGGLHSLVIPGDLHFVEIEALVKLAGLPGELGDKLQKL